ncbi:MAG: TonB-dependent receptor [Hyphomicrobiaceae bacterium]|nr:TonB-dependent receptor [Hyphomicrobiaceae bacterium]
MGQSGNERGRRAYGPIQATLAVGSAVSAFLLLAAIGIAHAQVPSSAPAAGTTLPTVPVEPPTAQPKAPLAVPAPAPKAATPAPKAVPKAQAKAQPVPPPAPPAPVAAPEPAATAPSAAGSVAREGSLTVPTTAEARRELAGIPGSVSVVADTSFKNDTPATTIKDVLDYVPGVFVQPRWGEDSRLSIRGSGLSRNFHLRGVTMLMDGMPINTADGHGDFQEIDPTAYRFVEVYKGAAGMRFGLSTLGGAVNFVTPTGRDASLISAGIDVGSFGFHRLQASTGAAAGPFDFFVTGTWQEQDGYRVHSAGEAARLSGNVGFRLGADVETRFFFNANDIKQEIPGTVTRRVALDRPKDAAAINVLNDWHRDVESYRIGNKTTFRLAPGTVLEVGAFAVDRHLVHPIFLYFDYQYRDVGGFGKLTHETSIHGFKDRLVVGFNAHDGTTDAHRFLNIGGDKGPEVTRWLQTSRNTSAFAENYFYFLPTVALMTGTHFLHAVREQEDRLGFGSEGRDEFNAWSPKAGLLWEISRNAQAFLNVSRSAEVPLFDDLYHPFTGAHLDTRLQRATTVEIGTRGRLTDFTWDIAAYHSRIKNELQCVFPFGIADFCIVENADKTIHQGVELGFGAAIWRGILRGHDDDKTDRLWLNAAYTFSDFRFDGDPQFGDNELPGAPRHFVRAELLYKHPAGFYFGPNVELVPEAYFVDSANTLKTAAYSLLGLKAGYDGQHFSAYVEGRNLTDEHYIASTGITNVGHPDFTNLFEPGNGRAVYGGVKYKW